MRLAKAIGCSALFVILAINSAAASAVGYAEHTSQISGVALLWLSGGGQYPVSAYFELNRKNAFSSYCNGKNKIYIYELGSKPFVCRSQQDGELAYRIDVLGLTREMDGIYTVSRHRMPRRPWQLEQLNAAETADARAALKEHYRHKHSVGYAYRPAFGRYNQFEKKLRIGGAEIVLVPTEEKQQEQYKNIVVSILAREDRSYRYLGMFEGCMERLADVDGDGFPEVLTKNCESSEGLSFEYWKIFPKVKRLVSYSQS